MVKTRTQLITTIKGYAKELERLGLPVDKIILFGSYRYEKATEDSDIDLAVFSELFGNSDHLEFSGLLSKAKWNTEPSIEAIGFNPSVLDNPPNFSLISEIIQDGEVVYNRNVA